jgi:hypothetical protein
MFANVAQELMSPWMPSYYQSCPGLSAKICLDAHVARNINTPGRIWRYPGLFIKIMFVNVAQESISPWML